MGRVSHVDMPWAFGSCPRSSLFPNSLMVFLTEAVLPLHPTLGIVGMGGDILDYQ